MTTQLRAPANLSVVIIFKHPVAFIYKYIYIYIYTSYTKYTVFNAT
jgi:hypothetical protein